MALACVEPLTQTVWSEASGLAALWKVPLREQFTGSKGIKVVVGESTLGIGFVDPKKGKPYHIDFLSHSWKTRFAKGLPRNHIFRRALGDCQRVIDATAGFGGDSVMALCLGCEVTAVEKSPVVVAVLRNGLMRASREDETIRPRLEKLRVVETDSIEYLASAERAEAIYLDPMFEKPKKSAKSPKEMQLLQELLAPTTAEESEKLFAVAYDRALSRVVVKRPLKAKALGRTPTHSYKGQSIRYDVYVKS